MFNTKISAETKASMKLAAKYALAFAGTAAAVTVAVVYRQEIGNAAVTGFNAAKNALGCTTDTVTDAVSVTLE